MRASLLLCLMSLLASDVARGQIFVAGGTNVAVYNLGGSAINTSLITGLNSATYLAISGSNLFVTSTNGGTVGKYTTAGATVNGSFVSGLFAPSDILGSGDTLYVINFNSSTSND